MRLADSACLATATQAPFHCEARSALECTPHGASHALYATSAQEYCTARQAWERRATLHVGVGIASGFDPNMLRQRRATGCPMRIAFISDIHARLARLDAVLQDIDRVGVDQIVCLGDVATMGPDPRGVIQRLRDLACPCVQGNHDEFLIRPGLAREVYGRLPTVCENVEKCCEAIPEEDLDYLRSFVPSLTFNLPGGVDLLAFHGTPCSNMRMILPTTCDDDLDDIFADHDATVMIGGHTHEQMLRRHRDMLIANVGSVGMPWALPFQGWDGGPPAIAPWAEYAIVNADESAGVGVEFRRVALPADA